MSTQEQREYWKAQNIKRKQYLKEYYHIYHLKQNVIQLSTESTNYNFKEDVYSNLAIKENKKPSKETKTKRGIPHRRYYYILSNGKDLFEFFTEAEKSSITHKFCIKKSNIIIYKGITIERKLKELIEDDYQI
jgi:hypothetical protein